MFGERTGESDANLYPTNWKQQIPAPELHSGPYVHHQAEGNVGGWWGMGDGVMGWRLGSVSMVALFQSLQIEQTLVCVPEEIQCLLSKCLWEFLCVCSCACSLVCVCVCMKDFLAVMLLWQSHAHMLSTDPGPPCLSRGRRETSA